MHASTSHEVHQEELVQINMKLQFQVVLQLILKSVRENLQTINSFQSVLLLGLKYNSCINILPQRVKFSPD